MWNLLSQKFQKKKKNRLETPLKKDKKCKFRQMLIVKKRLKSFSITHTHGRAHKHARIHTRRPAHTARMREHMQPCTHSPARSQQGGKLISEANRKIAGKMQKFLKIAEKLTSEIYTFLQERLGKIRFLFFFKELRLLIVLILQHWSMF